MKIFYGLFLIVVFLVTFALPASAQPSIDIKGLRIGMTKAEVFEIVPSLDDFTLGGVRGKYRLFIGYHEGKVDEITFLFDVNQFSGMLHAFKNKYEALACESSKISKALGASIDQMICSFDDSNERLSLTRYANLDTSSVMLMSKRGAEEKKQKAAVSKKDI